MLSWEQVDGTLLLMPIPFVAFPIFFFFFYMLIEFDFSSK